MSARRAVQISTSGWPDFRPAWRHSATVVEARCHLLPRLPERGRVSPWAGVQVRGHVIKEPVDTMRTYTLHAYIHISSCCVAERFGIRVPKLLATQYEDIRMYTCKNCARSTANTRKYMQLPVSRATQGICSKPMSTHSGSRGMIAQTSSSAIAERRRCRVG